MANTLETIMQDLHTQDPEIADCILREFQRQKQNIELIASENIASPAVIEAMGTVLTNKYAEGYPGKRYYGGCDHVDALESIAISRAKTLFGAAYANVQPHSGAQANLAVYAALLQPGDTLMGMDLSCGGHLSHGAKVNLSGTYYNSISYGVHPETGYLDYDQIEDMVRQYRPKLLVAGASAYPRAIDFEALAGIAHRHGALLMVDMAHIAGLVAGGQHMNPVPYADVVTTTTHKTLRGPRGGMILARDDAFAKRLNSAVFPGTQGGPLMHVIAGKAVCLREAAQPEFRVYAKQVCENAKALADALLARGFDLVTGGTDNHLMLADLRKKHITGKELQIRLDQVHITVNKNAIPKDPQKPGVTSGIRIGTPACTTRGFTPEDMPAIAQCIDLAASDFESARAFILQTVSELVAKHPIYET
ncbi:MAG: serine hydroxymethyltransferase [Candidatus Avoscillospira sp.]